MYSDVHRKFIETRTHPLDGRSVGTGCDIHASLRHPAKVTEQSKEINAFYRRVLEYSLIVSQIKADSWRFETARERYNLLLHHHPEIIKRAPLSHIASYLLMTPETLSRVRSGVL